MGTARLKRAWESEEEGERKDEEFKETAGTEEMEKERKRHKRGEEEKNVRSTC